jgi:hypothetical protein
LRVHRPADHRRTGVSPTIRAMAQAWVSAWPSA